MLINGGPTSGTIIKIISRKSRKKPITNIASITIKKAPISPPGRFDKNSSIILSFSKPLKTSENSEALSKLKHHRRDFYGIRATRKSVL